MGSEPTVAVSSPDGDSAVVVALRGATLLSWQVRGPDGPLQLTDGYRDAEELLGQNGVRNGVLAPFPNRVAQGRYRFDGRDHDLLPGRADRLVYHGFVRTAVFDVVQAGGTPTGARLCLRTGITPDQHPGYPFALDVLVFYTITADSLDIDVRATNTGRTAAPYAAGWHPYFRLSDAGIDDLVLRIPADTVVRTDDALIPLAGDLGREAVDRLPAADFRTPARIGTRVIDACYTDLRPDRAGRTETVLADPATGGQIRVWQTSGSMHVFTGDTLARDRRRSIALEPVETITDAFNRDDLAAQIRVEPGRQRRFSFGAAYRAGVKR